MLSIIQLKKKLEIKTEIRNINQWIVIFINKWQFYIIYYEFIIDKSYLWFIIIDIYFIMKLNIIYNYQI